MIPRLCNPVEEISQLQRNKRVWMQSMRCYTGSMPVYMLSNMSIGKEIFNLHSGGYQCVFLIIPESTNQEISFSEMADKPGRAKIFRREWSQVLGNTLKTVESRVWPKIYHHFFQKAVTRKTVGKSPRPRAGKDRKLSENPESREKEKHSEILLGERCGSLECRCKPNR